jgi:hypothetical protein
VTRPMSPTKLPSSRFTNWNRHLCQKLRSGFQEHRGCFARKPLIRRKRGSGLLVLSNGKGVIRKDLPRIAVTLLESGSPSLRKVYFRLLRQWLSPFYRYTGSIGAKLWFFSLRS